MLSIRAFDHVDRRVIVCSQVKLQSKMKYVQSSQGDLGQRDHQLSYYYSVFIRLTTVIFIQELL